MVDSGAARVENDKITTSVSYFDNLGFITQLGGTVVMPGDEEIVIFYFPCQ